MSRRYPDYAESRSITQINHRYHGVALPTSGPMVEAKPLLEQYTPGQQVALVRLRGNELCVAILEKLKHSTVIETPDDRAALVEQRLAIRRHNGDHVLTPQGMWIGSRVAADLAHKLGIDPIHHKPRRRSLYGGTGRGTHFW